MQSVNATDVRKDFGKYIDEIVRSKPIMVKRSRDYFLGISVEMMLELVEDEVFSATTFLEDDGTVTLALDHYDLVVNGTDQESALDSMVAELREYAEEYYDNIRFWSSDTLRKKQIKGILKVLLTENNEALKESILCRAGKS
jgi:hypothetical protein